MLEGGLEGRRVLFISYNGMLEPLGQSQVIPYLRELAKRGVQFTLLSFERAKAFTSEGAKQCEELREKLASQGIEWHWLRYHQRPSVPATIYDVVAGIRKASSLVQKNRIEMVHARGHIPATIAVALKKRFGTKMIFDLRGLMAEEYVDAGHWQKGSLPYRITKGTESHIFSETDAIVTLTERIWPIIREWDGLRGRTSQDGPAGTAHDDPARTSQDGPAGTTHDDPARTSQEGGLAPALTQKTRPVHHEVIPCCVDLSLFKFCEQDRQRRRAELNLGDRFTMVYSGSLDGWYLTEQMADFFAAFLQHKRDAHLLWLTTGSHDRVRELMKRRQVESESFSVLSIAPAEVPSYLAAADAGLAFIKRCVSKIASSPTKNGEYLACGLPLILNAGVGDSDSLINDWKAGVLIEDFSFHDFSEAARAIEELVGEPDVRNKARAVAKQLFDLKAIGAARYAALYERVLTTDSHG